MMGNGGLRPVCAVALSVLLSLPSFAQQGSEDSAMPDMKMDAGTMPSMHPRNFIETIKHHTSSGTSSEPNSTPVPMLMSNKGPWMLMFHAVAFLDDTQQTSPRGTDKLFSTNWVMPMAQRALGPGKLTLRAMVSLEPATISGERYPLLFQQGETAYGMPIADGQHPHNFIMEAGVLYGLPLGAKGLITFYVAPVGDPAIGPVAYPHRSSAAENPVGTLGHHQEDSTHISYDVATVGVTCGIVRAEVSGFHGREPNEHRWQVQQGAMDSWSTRLTLQPGQNWSGQYSYSRIASPEALFPSEDQERMTASVMYNRPSTHGNWASTALWGRTRSLSDSAKENSYLVESTLQFADRNYAFTRIENAGRSNELLVGEHPLPEGFAEMPLTHVQAFTFGFDRDVNLLPHLSTAIGAQASVYSVGRPIQPVYGSDPIGFDIFIRVRPSAENPR